MQRKMTVAFLGTRHPHMWHRVAIFQLMTDRIEVIGFFDEDEYFAVGFEARTNFRRFSDLNTLLALRPDLCVVEAMDTQTPELARKAAPYTRVLLLEKCAAPTYTEMLSLANELKCYPVHIEHGYELHYLDITCKCREIIASGVLGQITLARFHGGSPIGCSTEMWVSDPRLMGGMFYIEGSHMIEIMLDTLGEPQSVTGVAVKLPPGDTMISDLKTSDLFAGAGKPPAEVAVGMMAYEDVAAAIATYNDRIATIDCTAWEATGWCQDWRMEYYGTNGTLIACPFPSWARLFVRNARGGYERGEHRFKLPALTSDGDTQMRGAYRRQIMRLHDLLITDTPPDQRGMQIMLSVARVAADVYGTSK